MKECRIVFSDEFANRKAHPSAKKYGYFKDSYLRCRAHGTSQALPALKAIIQSVHQQECTGVYMPSVGIVGAE
jgi:hypothetical protein